MAKSKRRSTAKRGSAVKRRSTIRYKATAKKAKTVTASNALKALGALGANCKPIGRGKINMAAVKKFMDKMKKKGIPFHRIRFVALNAPFMRRPPVPPV